MLSEFLSDGADLQKLFKLDLEPLQDICLEITKKRLPTRNECVMALYSAMKSSTYDAMILYVRMAWQRQGLIHDIDSVIRNRGFHPDTLTAVTKCCNKPFSVMKLVLKHGGFDDVDLVALLEKVRNGLE